jgi:hypothetical protein
MAFFNYQGAPSPAADMRTRAVGEYWACMLPAQPRKAVPMTAEAQAAAQAAAKAAAAAREEAASGARAEQLALLKSAATGKPAVPHPTVDFLSKPVPGSGSLWLPHWGADAGQAWADGAEKPRLAVATAEQAKEDAAGKKEEEEKEKAKAKEEAEKKKGEARARAMSGGGGGMMGGMMAAVGAAGGDKPKAKAAAKAKAGGAGKAPEKKLTAEQLATLLLSQDEDVFEEKEERVAKVRGTPTTL